MKKALILGTNAGQADIIRYLKESGWEVHSCGYRKIGPGVELSDEFHLVNITDYDNLKTLVEQIKPDLVYSISSDIAVNMATKISEQLGLPHLLNHELIDLFNYKQDLRSFLNKNGLSKVEYAVIENVDELGNWTTFPCIVKPVDSQGQRGLALIHDERELFPAIEHAFKFSSSVIIEEYLDGVEFSTNMIVENGHVLVNEFTERLVHPLPLIGIPCGHSIPVRNISDQVLEKTRDMTVTLVEKLEIQDAVLYIQLKATSNGPKIIEVAPRLDGCHIWRLLKQAKGYDLRKLVIDLLMKQPIDIQAGPLNEKKYSLMFHQLKTGEPFAQSKLNGPKQSFYNEFRYDEGEEIAPINGTLEVVGYYIDES